MDRRIDAVESLDRQRCHRLAWRAVGLTAVMVAAGPALALGPLAGASTPATATAANKVVLTVADNGQTVTVTKGERVKVKLSSKGFEWTEASVEVGTNPPILQKVSGHVSASGASVAVFKVVAYGSAELQATGTAVCNPGPVCDPLVQRWQATVSAPVQDPPPPSAA